jgi:DNA-binding NarL/FixJ family response regulator
VTTVLLADDQELVRAGFRLVLELAGIEVVGEAGNGDEAVALAHRLRPDVALMDVRMPGTDGIEATRRIVADGLPTQVLILTTFDLDEHVYDALQAGASGFLLKDVGRAQLVDAVRTVAEGDALFAPTVLRRLVAHYVARPALDRAPPHTLEELSKREIEILRLLGHGLSNGEIADELVISLATVKTHVRHILQKLRLRDRVQAVVLAYESGLLQPGDASDANPAKP